jgi:hypothetical protein
LRKDEVVLLVINPVDLVDDLSHARSSSRGRSLGVAVCQVRQDILENVVNLDDQVAPKILQLSDIFEHWKSLHLEDDLPEDRLEVEHDVLGRELFGLVDLEILHAEEFESRRRHVAHRLHQKLLDALLDLLVESALEECLAPAGQVALPELEAEVKGVLQHLVSGLQKVPKLLAVMELIFRLHVADA